ncbi:MAG: 50S ribosomal protein L9 [Planctomycetaceae bacterium]|nr:MAG: 50S ribosomal protein L9 [Planctomycetaceae bacterium]
MKVILKENVESLGKTGDMLNVTDGYARNFLIPRDLAIEANSRNIKALKHEKMLIAHKAEREKKKAESVLEEFSDVTCTISKRIGEQDKLFGSVTTKDIEKSLHEQGIEIDRKNIVLEEPIKSTGEFSVKVKLSPEVTAEITVSVVGEE